MCSKTESQLAIATESIAALQQAVKLTDSRLQEEREGDWQKLLAARESMEEQMTALRLQLADLNQLSVDTNVSMTESEGRNRSLIKANVKTLETKITNVTAAGEESAQSFFALMSELQTQFLEISKEVSPSQEPKEIEELRSLFQKQFQDVDTELAFMRGALGEKTEQVSRAELQIATLGDEQAKLAGQTLSLEERAQHFEQQHLAFDASLSEVRADVGAMQESQHSLQKQDAELRGELGALAAKVSNDRENRDNLAGANLLQPCVIGLDPITAALRDRIGANLLQPCVIRSHSNCDRLTLAVPLPGTVTPFGVLIRCARNGHRRFCYQVVAFLHAQSEVEQTVANLAEKVNPMLRELEVDRERAREREREEEARSCSSTPAADTVMAERMQEIGS
eukprot:2996935-Rhodomonas_salina.1